MEKLLAVAEALKAKKAFKLDMIIGLDGFVDEIVHLVDKRENFSSYERIRTISQFGERISRAAGLSANIEMVPIQTKLGGNGPILSNALLAYGVDLTYVGALGKPDVNPVFESFTSRAKQIYSLCNPGHTDAAEFEDGKIMLGKQTHLKELTWDAMRDAMGGAAGIAAHINNTQLFGMENWTMMPNMSAVWEGLIKEVFPLIKTRGEKPLAFFDIADPEKRTAEDLCHAMHLISQFEQKFHVILGLNERETYAVAEVLGVSMTDADAGAKLSASEKLKQTVLAIAEKMQIHCLMEHSAKFACCVINGEFFSMHGQYCENPKLTTGAGDNFNAGFCLGMALKLGAWESVVLGIASSGYYVRNAESPTLDKVIAFIEQWAAGQLDK